MSQGFTRPSSLTFSYTGLSDTPGSFVGDALKFLRVNAGETAIEHVTPTTSLIAEGSNLYFTDERVDDRIAALIQNGTGLTWTYVDGSNTLTGNVSLASFSTTNLAEGSNLYFTDERAQDAVGSILLDSSTIDFTYSDGTPSITASVIANTSIQKVEVVKNSGAVVGTRKQLNFIEGSNISLTIADDAGNDQVDITITGSAGYTDEQAQDAIGTILLDSASINFTYDDATPNITAIVIPAGSDTYVQFNDGGILGADADFTFDKATNVLNVGTGATGTVAAKVKLETTWWLNTDANFNVVISDTYPAVQESVLIGVESFDNPSGNSQNIGIGHFTGQNVQGDSHIAIGYSAMKIQGSGIALTGNIAIGDFSLQRLVAGADFNTAVGHEALAGQQTGVHLEGSYNSAFGYQAGKFMQNDANFNFVAGYRAGYALGFQNDDNIAIGQQALFTEGVSAQGSKRNIAIGGYALHLQDGGGDGGNIAVGWEAGYNNEGEYNVFIGYQAGKAETTTDHTLIIANNDTTNLIVGDFLTGDVTIQRSVSLTLGSDAEGDIYYRDSTGFLNRIAAHATSGFVLTSNGAGTAPSYQAAAAGYSDEQAQDAVGTILVDSSSIDFTYNDGVPSITASVIEAGLTLNNIGGILSLAKGGTNKNMTASAGSVAYSDADSLELSAVGTTGQALISGGTGAPTWFAPTAGSVIFAGTGGILQQDNTNFFWDDTANKLGIGDMQSAGIVGAVTVRTSASDTRISIINDVLAATGSATLSIHNYNSGTATAFVNFVNYGSGVGGNIIASIPFARTFYTVADQAMDNYLTNVRDGNWILATTDVERLRIAGNGDVTWTLGGDATGDIWYRDASGFMVPLAIGSANDILQVVGGVPTWQAPGAGTSPLTTKGDIYTYSTSDDRLPVGTDGFVLSADSGEATGLKWISAPSGGYTTHLVITTTYTVTETSGEHVYLVDCTTAGGQVTATCPDASTTTAKYTFKKIDSGSDTVIVDTAAGDIDGDVSKEILFQNTTFTIITDGTDYWRVN